MGFEGFPFIIGWELTLACNLRCLHCGSSAGYSRVKELSLDECLSICDQLPALLVQEVNFTGGEPLIRPEWPKITAYLARLGIPTKVLTNGLTLRPNVLAQLRDTGVAGIGVSLDGMEATHDRIRGYEGLFGRVLEGINKALAAGFPVTIITTANGLNIAELPQMQALLQSIGIRRWQIQPIFPLGRAAEYSELDLSYEQFLQLGVFVRDWTPKAKENEFEILPGDSYGYFTELDIREPEWHGCPAGIYSCGITSDGKIKGCLSMPDELVEGDLRQNDLWDIWFHPDSFTYTRKFTTDTLGPNCSSCLLAEQCQGGCTAMSYGSTGRVHNNPYCFTGITGREFARLPFTHSQATPLHPCT